jgi:hypothetical protein
MCEKQTKGGTKSSQGELDLCREEINGGVEVQGSRTKRKRMGGKLGEVMGNAITGI